ncbi:MAG TPA: Zn-dependent hydrolase, partial [Thermoleophilia bacterium]|nr:Zn-dependent hydrolase [Thermoleophilia bacterium]
MCGDVVTVGPSTTRVLQRLSALERERTAFSAADMTGRDQVAEMMRDAGLSVTIDAGFNVIGTMAGVERRRPLVVGSHLDTVADPGRLDGALGVLAAIECAESMRSALPLRHPLTVVGFSDEEGSATGGCWGARAMTGTLTPGEKALLADPQSELAQTLTRAASELRTLGWDIDPLAVGRYEPVDPAGYLELHIEQGPVLERTGTPTGTVTSIVGINRYDVIVPGSSGHAGTVPMADRGNDALLRAGEIMRAYWAAVLSHGARAVVNFGRCEVIPGSYNVIPGEVRLAVEIRSPEATILDQLEGDLERISSGSGACVKTIGRDAPVELSEEIRGAVLEVAAASGIPCRELPSWAGHDAAIFAGIVPSGMI